MSTSTRTKRPGTTSRHRGVSYDVRTDRWRVQIWTNGRQVYIGNFETENIAASKARLAFRAYGPIRLGT